MDPVPPRATLFNYQMKTGNTVSNEKLCPIIYLSYLDITRLVLILIKLFLLISIIGQFIRVFSEKLRLNR